MESERKGHQTKQTYCVYLKARIVPRWGACRIRDINTVAVERWLGTLDDLSNGTRAKSKVIMSEVFQHAIRYGWLNDGENPILAVRQSTKRERVTGPLEAAEFRELMQKLPPMMRVIGILAATTGLRISEVRSEVDSHRLERAIPECTDFSHYWTLNGPHSAVQTDRRLCSVMYTPLRI